MKLLVLPNSLLGGGSRLKTRYVSKSMLYAMTRNDYRLDCHVHCPTCSFATGFDWIFVKDLDDRLNMTTASRVIDNKETNVGYLQSWASSPKDCIENLSIHVNKVKSARSSPARIYSRLMLVSHAFEVADLHFLGSTLLL